MLAKMLFRVAYALVMVLAMLVNIGIQLARWAFGDKALLKACGMMLQDAHVQQFASKYGFSGAIMGAQHMIDAYLLRAAGGTPAPRISPTQPEGPPPPCRQGPEDITKGLNAAFTGRSIRKVLLFDTPDQNSHICIFTEDGALDLAAPTLAFCPMDYTAAQSLSEIVEASC